MQHAFFLWFVGCFLIFLQTLPWNLLFPRIIIPNVSFAVVVLAGFRGGSLSSWPLALALGYILESLSGSPRGLISLINLMVLLVFRVLAGYVLLERLSVQVAALFFLCVASHIILLVASGAAANCSAFVILAHTVLHSGLVAAVGIPLMIFSNTFLREKER